MTLVLIFFGLVIVAAIVLGFWGKLFGSGTEAADTRLDRIRSYLPGIDCGVCGKPDCASFALALMGAEAEIDNCAPAGPAARKRIAGVLDIYYREPEPRSAVVFCQGSFDKTTRKPDSSAAADCGSAVISDGDGSCRYGCLGFGDCVKACKFNAIQIRDGLAVVDEKICNACGRCVEACPRNLIRILPRSKKVQVMCSSLDKGANVRKACSVGCIACKKCVNTCPFKAAICEGFKAEILIDKCTNCGLCAPLCPNGCIVDSATVHLKARIDPQICSRCGICESSCVAQAISKGDGEQYLVEERRCICCSVCAGMCPSGAIKQYDPAETIRR